MMFTLNAIPECKNGYISRQTWNITFVDRWTTVMFPWGTNFVKTSFILYIIYNVRYNNTNCFDIKIITHSLTLLLVCIVDIGGIVDHLCLNCLLITHSLTLLLVGILFVGLWYLMLQNNFNIETICIIIPYIIYYI
jgi:hypothetical protein